MTQSFQAGLHLLLQFRTDSIDYAVVMSGEIDMEMDDTVVQLQAGDVLVQRGTSHNWVNTEPCVIAFVLISSDSNTAIGEECAHGREGRIAMRPRVHLYSTLRCRDPFHHPQKPSAFAATSRPACGNQSTSGLD